MKTVAIIQARMGSTRLPGKVLLPLGESTVLGCVIDRVAQCRELDSVVVATTERAEDNAVRTEAALHGAEIFRGSELDVLKRFNDCAEAFGADVVVRITGDCPLLNSDLLSEMMIAFRNGHFDYFSNTVDRSYPKGLDIEIFTRAALEKAHLEAVTLYDREHVTPYMKSGAFRVGQQRYKYDLSEHRWTIDTQKDYEYVSYIWDVYC